MTVPPLITVFIIMVGIVFIVPSALKKIGEWVCNKYSNFNYMLACNDSKYFSALRRVWV